MPVAREQVGERRAPRAARRSPRTRHSPARPSVVAPALPVRRSDRSSPRRSRPMFARCVQKTKSATTTLTSEQRRRDAARERDRDGQHDGAERASRATRSRWRGRRATNTTNVTRDRQRREREEHARAVATPFPPPLPTAGRSAARGRRSPRCRTRSPRRTGARATPNDRGEAAAPGAAPFAASSDEHERSPIFAPSTRKTFVAPRFPSRAVRRSTPLQPCPRGTPPGSSPTRYASDERDRRHRLQLTPPCAAAGCAADCRVNPHDSRNPLCR